jgi:DNA repair exonuclease SbcCD ATPase subunit
MTEEQKKMEENQEETQEEQDVSVPDFENVTPDEEKTIPEDETAVPEEEPVVPDQVGEAAEIEDSEELEEDILPEKKGISKFRKILRRVLIGLIILIVFYLVGYGVSYITTIKPLKNQQEMLQADLEARQTQIEALENENEQLAQFEEANQVLKEENQDLETQLTIKIAQASVSDAIIALKEENLDEARLELSKVDETLEDLKGMLSSDQQGVVENMQTQLEVVREDLDEYAESAESNLKALSEKLIKLENTLFAGP